MKTPLNAIALAGIVTTSLFVSGCATRFKPSASHNPPPAEILSSFTAFEIQAVSIAPAYANNGANQKALAKIQSNMSASVDPVLASWNQAGAGQGKDARTLVIDPLVTDIKFIGGFARFMVGPLAGSSAVIMRATLTDKETGQVVAAPEFYVAANAHGGAMTMGTTDNRMLSAIVENFKEYLLKNYAMLVGGPTGAY